ncbi:MAG: amidohydrolase [Oscillospiraceae bacterium]|jgi:5-methylthioadenosine/S-adenosylhomocysteine deaminase|nr:amidohydrolase [Oscillospiraceae bacterium]
MLFNNITIIDENQNVRPNMFVGIKDDKIAFIGDSKPYDDFGEVYAGDGRLLMSAFYNCHAHTPMTLLRGYGENLALQDWLETRIFPFEDKMNGEDVYIGTMLGLAESVRFGIVSVTDMYAFCDDMVRAFSEAKVKGNIGRAIVNFTDEDLYDTVRFKEAAELYKNFHNTADGRIKIDMSLHAEYTSNPKTVRRLAEYTGEIGTRMHVHVSETKFEHEECKKRHGKTPAAYLNEMGLFDSPTTAAHCVHLEDGDIAVLKEKGVTVASCPVSNLKLASGTCNVPALKAAGINVAVGTDGTASNNSLNFIEEMKFFSLLHKGIFASPAASPPRDTLYAATRAGALSQGREDCGLLKTGFAADLIVLDITKPNMNPAHDLVNNVVYSACGGDIILTMADGKILYKDGEYLTIDYERVVSQAHRATSAILDKLS